MTKGDPTSDLADPTFRITFLFHSDVDLLSTTLPRCVEALAGATRETYEVVLHCDGTPPEILERLPKLIAAWGVDEMIVRRRERFVASGDASNNGHRRLLTSRSPYVVVIEDDVVMYRTDPCFDVLAACKALFERRPDVPVIAKVDDHHRWSWRLQDLGAPIEDGVRSTNRLSTHFVAYHVARFTTVAKRFGAWNLDLFIDRDDYSYNWEDLVSHVGTTGGRRIAFAEDWPLLVFHCDRKVADGSIWHTQDSAVKAAILAGYEERYGPKSHEGDAR